MTPINNEIKMDQFVNQKFWIWRLLVPYNSCSYDFDDSKMFGITNIICLCTTVDRLFQQSHKLENSF